MGAVRIGKVKEQYRNGIESNKKVSDYYSLEGNFNICGTSGIFVGHCGYVECVTSWVGFGASLGWRCGSSGAGVLGCWPNDFLSFLCCLLNSFNCPPISDPTLFGSF